MSYIKPEMAKCAIMKMKTFHDTIVGVYNDFDMNLLDNLGRRNIVMSQTQEKFFAQELATAYGGVHEDGRTGQPDIVIGGLDKELECKLTSRHKGGAISFSTDHGTLAQKGELDYLYVIADHDFKAFAVLHFERLTVDDFRPVANGSRGKVAMYKHKGMAKCTVLLGSVVNNKEVNLKKLHEKLGDHESLPNYKRDKCLKSLEYWETHPARYTFELEEVFESGE
jgi:hypothetical protein